MQSTAGTRSHAPAWERSPGRSSVLFRHALGRVVMQALGSQGGGDKISPLSAAGQDNIREKMSGLLDINITRRLYSDHEMEHRDGR
jgi:hypothetical protein